MVGGGGPGAGWGCGAAVNRAGGSEPGGRGLAHTMRWRTSSNQEVEV